MQPHCSSSYFLSPFLLLPKFHMTSTSTFPQSQFRKDCPDCFRPRHGCFPGHIFCTRCNFIFFLCNTGHIRHHPDIDRKQDPLPRFEPSYIHLSRFFVKFSATTAVTSCPVCVTRFFYHSVIRTHDDKTFFVQTVRRTSFHSRNLRDGILQFPKINKGFAICFHRFFACAAAF